MNGGMKGLDFGGLGDRDEAPEEPKVLSAASFVPRPDGPSPAAKAAAAMTTFPSREPGAVAEPGSDYLPNNIQINGYVPREVALRFKEMSKRERYSYGALIALLFEHYEKTRPQS